MQNAALETQMLNAAILVVDDDAVTRTMLEKALRQRGFTSISCVDSGVKALAHIQLSPPDMVILDIAMTGVNGLECCEWIRAQDALRELPVLMLTGLTDEKMRFRSFEAGATDFVCKPLHPEELYARVRVHLLNRLGKKSLQHYKDRLQMELASAQELQQSILPQQEELAEVNQRCKLDIASYLSTSSEIGGDFWGMKSLFEHQTALWMADLSGHGVAAALNAFRLQAYLKEHITITSRPGEYLSHLNEKLLHLLLRGSFATMFYGIVDTRGNRLHYACACNPHPLIVRKNGDVQRLDGSGTPLGICMQYYHTQTIEFHPGDTLLLYSDAMTETPDASGDFITEDQLMTWLSEQRHASAETIRDMMVQRFKEHRKSAPTDDLTLCICRRMD